MVESSSPWNNVAHQWNLLRLYLRSRLFQEPLQCLGQVLDAQQIDLEWLIDVAWFDDFSICVVRLHSPCRLPHEWSVSLTLKLSWHLPAIVFGIGCRLLGWEFLWWIPVEDWDMLVARDLLLVERLVLSMSSHDGTSWASPVIPISFEKWQPPITLMRLILKRSD